MYQMLFLLLVLPTAVVGRDPIPCSTELESFSVTVTEIDALTCALGKLSGCGEIVLTEDEKAALAFVTDGTGNRSFLEVTSTPGPAAGGTAGCTATCPKGSCSCSGSNLCGCSCGVFGNPRCGGASGNFQAAPSPGGEP